MTPDVVVDPFTLGYLLAQRPQHLDRPVTVPASLHAALTGDDAKSIMRLLRPRWPKDGEAQGRPSMTADDLLRTFGELANRGFIKSVEPEPVARQRFEFIADRRSISAQAPTRVPLAAVLRDTLALVSSPGRRLVSLGYRFVNIVKREMAVLEIPQRISDPLLGDKVALIGGLEATLMPGFRRIRQALPWVVGAAVVGAAAAMGLPEGQAVYLRIQDP